MSERSPRVLVVEDESDLLEAMVQFLRLEGCAVEGAASLSEARVWISARAFDVVVMDLGLPDGDGLDWIREHVRLNDMGLVIATARGEGHERVAGVRAGADVYLVKPIQLEELTSVVYNLVRRLPVRAPTPWRIERLKWTLQAPNGQDVRLTHSEATLLSVVARTPGTPATRADIITALGHQPDYYDPRRMEILVRRLRSKCAQALGMKLPLATVHGTGYAFTEPLVLG